jgi:RNase adapter protein RapZ
MSSEQQRVVLVTGLSGGGKASVLRVLEYLGYEAVDNPPLRMLEEMVTRSGHKLAIGVDARSRGFDARLVLEALGRLSARPSVRLELVYVWADETTLLRRYTETRRRHPLAPQGRVADGIAREIMLTTPLQSGADLVIDTSDLPVPSLRRLIERHFGAGADAAGSQLVVSLISFAYKFGLPREADLVFDARFLRNPHYDPILQPRTGVDAEVGAFIEADPDFPMFFDRLAGLIDILLPRFVQEGKKYATITIGCTGGRHRSVYLIEKLADHLAVRIAAARASGDTGFGWQLHVTHRELAREGLEAGYLTGRPVPSTSGGTEYRGGAAAAAPVQAQEA